MAALFAPFHATSGRSARSGHATASCCGSDGVLRSERILSV